MTSMSDNGALTEAAREYAAVYAAQYSLENQTKLMPGRFQSRSAG